MSDDTDDTKDGVRKETDAQIITVPNGVDKPAYRVAMEKAAEENGHREQAVRNYTFEKCREFANSTMFAVWDTRQ